MVFEFAERGQGSKAWWLNLVRYHGASGLGLMATGAHMRDGGKYEEFKLVIDRLEEMGYIAQYQLQVVRRGKKPTCYKLTEKGARYLKKHRSDLKPSYTQNKSISKSRYHEVPEIDRSALPAVAPIDEDILRMENRPPAEEPEPQEPARQVFRKQLEALVMKVSLDKYGDQVTARDLLEALDQEDAA